MDDLFDLASEACEVAGQEGAEFVDVSAGRYRNLNVSLEKGAVKASDASWSSSVSVRAFHEGGVGWASAGTLEREKVKECARLAAAMAKEADPDPDFVGLVEPVEEYPEAPGIYDERLRELPISTLIEWCLANVDEALALEPEAIVSGGAGCGYGESVIVNGLGVRAGSEGTGCGVFVRAAIRGDDEVGIWYDFDTCRHLDDLEPAGLGRKAAEGARRYLGARDIPTATMPVVFGFMASGVYRSAVGAANAESVQRNRSYLVGKKGERIASELLTVVDDPLIPRGSSSSAFDGEGFPRKPLTIIEEGVLQTYLHNSYTANKGREANTGHSTRGGISPTNLNITLGERPLAELIAEVEDGLYVERGGVSPDMTTGDFSDTVDFGFKIEGGELAYPVRPVVLGGNVFDLLGGIEAISSDFREEPGSKMPAIRVDGVSVAGGA